MATGSVRTSPASPLPDSDEIFMSTGDEIETSILMESDTVRIEQQNGQSAPIGPGAAVDLIVANAARVAADAALADSARKNNPAGTAIRATRGVNSSNNKNAEVTPPTNLFPPDAKESRRKRVAAKSVLSQTPSTTAKSIPRHSTVLYKFEAYESNNKNAVVSPSRRGSPSRKASNATRSPPKTTKTNTKAGKAKAAPKKASKAAAKHTATPTTKNGQIPAKEIWSGKPTEDVGYSWNGWVKKTFQRQSGRTKGTTDSYWYTPKNQYRLRSLVEVQKYFELLKKHKTEEKAWAALKGR
jgi:hypothetical protein